MRGPGRLSISRIPLYRQIREYLLENIRSGTWDPAKPIPSENELAQQFKVSRITAKQALDTLVDDGLIYRMQGRGSFLSPDRRGEPQVYEARDAGAPAPPPRESRLLGYIAPRLNNMFMSGLLSEIEAAAATEGYRLLFARTNDSQALECQVLEEFEALGAAGLIVYPVEGELYNEAFLKLLLQRYPLVVIDRYLRGVETDCVCSDNFAAGRMAAEHLLELGHTRIAFVSHDTHGTSSVEDRLLGYEAALRAAGLPAGPELRLLTLKTLGGANKKEIRAFLEQQTDVTAVIGINSRIGGEILETAAELGLRVPGNLSLVMFDNQEPLSVVPTHIKQQEGEISRAAVRLLLEAIRDPAHKRTKLVFPTTLVVGKTSGPP